MMRGSRTEKIVFGGASAFVFAFLYLPLALIVLYAFNETNINSWPFPGFSTRWFDKLFHDQVPRDAAWLSVRIATVSTALALLFGTSMAFAFARFRFFGKELINFAVTLPIILPGVITGVALASFFLFTNTDLSTRTVIIGHTTFCIVLVFNNVLARLRRVSPSLEEASRDLGASGFQTFRHVTFPTIRTALVAGALLSFALSFDEIAVTFFLAGRGHHDAAALDPRRLPQQPERPGGERRRNGHPRVLAADDRARRLPDARRGRDSGRAGVAGRISRPASACSNERQRCSIETLLDPWPFGALQLIPAHVSAESFSVITSPAPTFTADAGPACSLKSLLGARSGGRPSSDCQPSLGAAWPGPVRLTFEPQLPEQSTRQSTVWSPSWPSQLPSPE